MYTFSVSLVFTGRQNDVGKHAVSCMFLSRVVIGRTRDQPGGVSSNPNDRVRNELYDDTRGAGGLLNPDAQYHTLRAADGSYFVIMDAMQCYPEYILFCSISQRCRWRAFPDTSACSKGS